MQTKLHSLLEAKANLILSYPITWAIYVWVLPWLFGVHLSGKQATSFIVVFSLSSVLRQYAIRRLFENRRLSKTKI